MTLASAVALCAATLAQTPPPATAPPPAPPPAAGQPAQAWRPGRHPSGERTAWGQKGPWEAHRAARATALHNILGIRPEQETAFQAYALQPPSTPAGAPRRPGWGRPEGQSSAAGAPTPLTAPERADAMLARFDDHAARLRERLARRAAAVKTLYAVLTPDQRRVFDALPALRGRGGEEGGWGRHGGGDRGPHGAGEGVGE